MHLYFTTSIICASPSANKSPCIRAACIKESRQHFYMFLLRSATGCENYDTSAVIHFLISISNEWSNPDSIRKIKRDAAVAEMKLTRLHTHVSLIDWKRYHGESRMGTEKTHIYWRGAARLCGWWINHEFLCKWATWEYWYLSLTFSKWSWLQVVFDILLNSFLSTDEAKNILI